MNVVLQGIASTFMVKYLGQYFEGLNKNELKFALWSGSVELTNLRLKGEVLNSLDLPVHVKAGFAGTIKLVIPWKSLRSQRIEAHIEKIFLVVGPRDESTFSDEADENREQARKQAALAHADLIKQSKNAVMKDSDSEGEGRSGSSWFWEKWIAPVIDNVQVSIGSVHIRYEDDETVPGTCFSAGVTLESLNVRSTDSNWVPMFVSEVTRAAHKLIHLQNLSIYLNTRDKILVDETKPPLSGSELAQLMDSLIAREGHPANHQFLLDPLSMEVKVRLNKTPGEDLPKQMVSVDIPHFALKLTQEQYQVVLALVDRLTTVPIRRKYRRYRPTMSVSEKPRAWWRFIRDALLGDIRAKKRRQSLEYISHRRRQRLAYMELWMAKLDNQLTTFDSKYQLQALEKDLSADDILYFRALSEAKYKSELSKRAQFASSKSRGGYIGWITGFVFGGDGNPADQPESDSMLESNEELSHISPELKEQIYEEMQLEKATDEGVVDERKANMSGTYVETEAHVRIHNISVSLKSSSASSSASRSSKERSESVGLCILHIHNTAVDVKLRPKHSNLSLRASLQSLELRDDRPIDKAFSSIIKSVATSMVDATGRNGHLPSLITRRAAAHQTYMPFFSVALEMNPISRDSGARLDSDLAVKLLLDPLQVVGNVPFFLALASLFQPPKEQVGQAALHDLEMEAIRRVESLKRDARLAISEQLVASKRKRMHFDINISAPKILIPLSLETTTSPSLAIDLGSLSVRSTTAPTFATQTESDNQVDAFKVALTDVNLLLLNVPNHADANRESLSLIDKFAIYVDMQMYHRGSALSRRRGASAAAIQVTTQLPQMDINISARLINQLLDIVSAVMKSIPKPASEGSKQSSPPSAQQSEKPRSSVPPTTQGNEVPLHDILQDEKSERDRLEEADTILQQSLESLRLVVKLGAINIHLLNSANEATNVLRRFLTLTIGGLGARVSITPSATNIRLALHNLQVRDVLGQVDMISSHQASSSALSSSPSPSLRRKQAVIPPESKDIILADVSLGSARSISTTYVTAAFGWLDIVVLQAPIAAALSMVQSIEFVCSIYCMTKLASLTSEEGQQREDQEREKEQAAAPPATPKLSSTEVKFKLEAINIAIQTTAGVDLALVSLARMALQLRLTSREGLVASGTISNITVDDCRDSAFHKSILGAVGEEMLDFSYFQAVSKPPSSPWQDPQPDAGIKVRLTSIRAIYVKEWVEDVIGWAKSFVASLPKSPNNRPNSKPKLPALPKPDDSALPKFFSFDVLVSQPQLVVPRSSTHPQLLVVDLGTLFARNTVKAYPKQRGYGLSLWMEEIEASLVGASVRMTEVDNEHYAQPLITKFGVDAIIRRVVVDEARKLPKMQMEVGISDIAISVNNEHIQMLLGIAQHMGESSVAPEPHFAEEVQVEEEEEEQDEALHDAESHPQQPPTTSNANSDGDDDEIDLAVDLSLNHFSIELMKTHPNTLSGVGRHLESLLQLHIVEVAVALAQTRSQATNLSVDIRSLSLHDSRPGAANKFKQIIGPPLAVVSASLTPATPSEQEAEKSALRAWTRDSKMVRIALVSTKQKVIVSAQINQPKVCVVTDPLFAVVELLESELASSSTPSPTTKTQGAKKLPSGGSKKQGTNGSKPSTTKTIVRAQLSELEIAVPRNPTSARSQAFVLKTGAFFEMKLTPKSLGAPIIKALVQQLQAFKCNMQRPESSALSLIDPFNIVVKMNPKAGKNSIHATLDPMSIKISYQDIVLALGIKKVILESPFMVKRSSKTPPAAAVAVDPMSNAPPPLPAPGTKQSITITSSGIQVILIDDARGRNLPLVCASMNNMHAKVGLSLVTKVSLDIELEVTHYSAEGATWEPVVEPWSATVMLLQKPLPVANGSSIGNGIPSSSVSVSLLAGQLMNINVTSAFIKTMLTTVKTWKEDLAGSMSEAAPRPASDPFQLRNLSGSPIFYWTDRTDEPIELAPDATASLTFASARGWKRSRLNPSAESASAAKIGLCIGEFAPIKGIPIGRPGTRVIELKSARSSRVFHIVLVVDNVGGVTLVSIRSPLLIQNNCKSRAIRIGTQEQSPLSQKQLAPGESWPIPLNWVLNSTNNEETSEGKDGSILGISSVLVDQKPCFFADTTTFAPYLVSVSKQVHRVWSYDHFYRRPGPSPLHTTPTPTPTPYPSTSQNGEELHAELITIQLSPPLRIDNRLPLSFDFSVVDRGAGVVVAEQVAETGDEFEVFYDRPCNDLLAKFKIPEFEWSNFVRVHTPSDLDSVLRLRDDKGRVLTMHVEHGIKSGGIVLTVFSQYWIVNRTGLPILFRPVESADSSTASGAADLAAGQSRLEKLVEDEGQNQQQHVDVSQHEIAVQREVKKPVLFSVKRSEKLGHFMQLKVSGSEWSKGICLDTVGWSGSVSVFDDANKSYQIAANIQLATPSKFMRTKMVVLTPQYIIVNQTDKPLYYRQRAVLDSKPVFSDSTDTLVLGAVDASCETLQPRERRAFHWPEFSRVPKLLSVKVGNDAQWSGGFGIDAVGEFSLNVRNDMNEISSLARIDIKMENATAFVIIRQESSEFPPYRVDNDSLEKIRVYQKRQRKSAMVLQAYESQPYAWEEPTGPHEIILELPDHGIKQHFNLDKLDFALEAAAAPLIKLPSSGVSLQPQVIADGPTRVFRVVDITRHSITQIRRVRIMNWAEPDCVISNSEFMEQRRSGAASAKLSIDEKEAVGSQQQERSWKPIEVIGLDFSANLRGFGLSVINSSPKELLYVTVEKISVAYSNSNLNQAMELKVGKMQIDNQQYDGNSHIPPSQRRAPSHGTWYTSPVMLSSSIVLDKPFLHVSFVKSNLYKDISFYRYFSSALQEVHLTLDRTLLEDIVAFVDELQTSITEGESKQPSILQEDICIPSLGSSDEQKLYFEMLQLHPVRLNASLVSTVSHVPISKDGKPIEKNAQPESAGYRFVQALGVSLGNIDGVTLSLNALIIPHPFVTQKELVSRIAQHYKYQLLRQIWKVFFSFDLFGSPLSLISSMGTGVYDFFYDPYKSLVSSPFSVIHSPFSVMQGIATGTFSLLRQSLYGVTNSTSKISRSVEKAMAKATPGSEQQWQDDSLRYMASPRNSLSLVGVGASRLFWSVVGSASGLVTSPVKGWKQGGASGMVGGLVNGVLDVGLRPSLAAVQLVHQTAEYFRVVAAPPAALRIRPPRLFVLPPSLNSDMPRRPPLTVYSIKFALGDYVYNQLLADESNSGILESLGEYEWHVTASDNEKYYIVTSRAILLAVYKERIRALRLRWFVFFNEIEDIDPRINNGQLAIRLRRPQFSISGQPLTGFKMHLDSGAAAQQVLSDLQEYIKHLKD